MILRPMILSLALLVSGVAQAQTGPAWTPVEGSAVIGDLPMARGSVLAGTRIHYRTLGQPARGPDGRVTNAVLLLHGTGGTGAQFLSPQFAGELFGPGQPLDVTRHYIIMPDNLGHGGSSKPSDGLRAAFPEYGYAEMVEAQRRLLVDGLGVDRLRLILGTSMGCMHIFVWGTTHPDLADALMPMACQPTAIVGRNRLWRTMLKDAIRSDPAWAGGDYQTQPVQGLRTAVDLLLLAGSAPMAMQRDLPTPDAVDGWLDGQMERRLPALDANDLWFQVNASWDYDPSADLERMTAPTTWINSADDFINPPELGLAERFAPRIANGTYRLIPNSPDGKGHGTHTWATFWKDDLIALLARTDR
ncbi:MAG: alpha/beta fold hydrolase [Brevundimonas sp.]|uniref:alpha/beta fold hydrolase n=1 Tax=Brevundimonas sp. TaxID=1871086 RepID=UPI0027336D10|nr:alpha/beta fold hydrolase [Brevundimonas sp.]MDP3405853.1 alpha/beta fold hydrolase [Brevundimonas sp.]